MQPTRFASQSLIDNILINSIEYMSYSGNLTIQISHHRLQFVILEGFFKEVLPKKINLYERNFKNFNEREFDEALKNCDWDSILALVQNDPNLSMENLYNNTIFLLDEFAPYRKLSKKDYKLKSKPWVNNEILTKIHERDKLLYKYSNAKDLSRKANLLKDYKSLRNSITNMKRDSKTKYYNEYFEIHKYLHQIKVNKSFYLTPTISEEIFDIIVSLDMNKSLGPNIVPIYIIKIYSRLFSEKLSHYKFIICNWYFSRFM